MRQTYQCSTVHTLLQDYSSAKQRGGQSAALAVCNTLTATSLLTTNWLTCSCIRKFGKSTQRTWLWLDVLSDLLFLTDLCLLLLSAYYTDRTANALVASQTASVEAGQHSQACLGHQQAAFDRKLSKLNLAAAPGEGGGSTRKDMLTRTMSRSKSKRDMTFMPGPAGGMRLSP